MTSDPLSSSDTSDQPSPGDAALASDSPMPLAETPDVPAASSSETPRVEETPQPAIGPATGPATEPATEPAIGPATGPATEPSEATASSSVEVPDQSSDKPAESESPQRFKIGSQRKDHRPEINRPRVTPPEPAKPVRDAAPSETGQQQPGEPTTSPDGDRPKGRRRKGPPEKKPREVPLEAPKTVPTPSVREKLSPDLEDELAAALGDSSLDDIFGDTKSSAAEEIETESLQKVRVVRVHRDDVFVEIGQIYQGMIPLKQFTDPPQPGTIVEAIVNRFNGEDGLYELTIPGASVDVGDWSQVSEGIVVDAVVTGHNKGGLECEVSKLRAFMPISQIALYRVDDIEKFVGEKMACVVIEANPEKRNLVLSHRAVLEREREQQKEKLLAELAVGQTREGVVRRLLDFGAFVDLGGVDGMIPIGHMSWDRIKHPTDVLAEGQTIKVHVERVDQQTGKISLSYRESWENPWDTAEEKYPIKKTFSGTVSKLMDFGAFVKLEAGIEGLIHISELAHQRVFRTGDVVSEGQEVEVQVLAVDSDAQRIGLSLKALMAKPEPAKKKQHKLPESDEPLEPTLPKRKGPLKGGFDRPTGGEGVGLQW